MAPAARRRLFRASVKSARCHSQSRWNEKKGISIKWKRKLKLIFSAVLYKQALSESISGGNLCEFL